MTAPVRIDACAWGDIRFVTLARLCGLAGGEHALIMCAKIWSWQTEHYTPDAPTYAIDIDLIESVLGTGGAVHMVRARLAEETPDGFRIKGSTGRIEWLWKKRLAAKAGGDATKRKHENRTGPHGQPNGQALGQPQGAPTASPLVPDLVPVQIPEALPLRAIPLSTQPQRKSLGDQAWERLNAMRIDLAEANAWIDVAPLHPMDPGRSELAARILECGADAEIRIEHVLQVAFAEARAKNTVEYLSGSMFRADSWAKKLAMRVEDAKRPPRANPQAAKGRSTGAIGASTPHKNHGTDMKPAKEVM